MKPPSRVRKEQGEHFSGDFFLPLRVHPWEAGQGHPLLELPSPRDDGSPVLSWRTKACPWSPRRARRGHGVEVGLHITWLDRTLSGQPSCYTHETGPKGIKLDSSKWGNLPIPPRRISALSGADGPHCHSCGGPPGGLAQPMANLRQKPAFFLFNNFCFVDLFSGFQMGHYVVYWIMISSVTGSKGYL